MLIEELNEHLALNLDPSPNQTKMVEPPISGIHCCYIVVGNSHAARTAAAIRNLGKPVVEVILPAWRPTPGQIADLASKVEEAVREAKAKYPEASLVLELLDNCFYYAQTEDGSLVPARRGHDGRYHIDGELVMAPKEIQFSTFKKLCGIFEKRGGARLILIPPIPRYFTASCCEDPEHIPNRLLPDYRTTLESAVYNCKTNLKDFAFREGVRNVRVINPWAVLKKLDRIWSDPIHLTEEGYVLIAEEVIEADSDLSNKRKQPQGNDSKAKRGRQDITRTGGSPRRPEQGVYPRGRLGHRGWRPARGQAFYGRRGFGNMWRPY